MLIDKKRIPVLQILLMGLLPSFFKKLVYKLKGYEIHNSVKLGFGAVIISDAVNIGEGTQIGFLTIIRSRKLRIGKYVNIGSLNYYDTEDIEIGTDTRIREQVFIAGLSNPASKFKCGERCLIMQMTSINPTKPVIIGDDSAIGGYSLLFTHSSWLSKLEGYPVKFGPINIGNKVWIPWRTFITSGVDIGNHVIIAPNSVINKDIPTKSMTRNDPFKILPNIFKRELSTEEKFEQIYAIIEKFKSYLEYHRYSVQLENPDSNVLLFTASTKNDVYNIDFIDSLSHYRSLDQNNRNAELLVILNDTCSYEDWQNSQAEMMISLEDLTRFGSSNSGEEFVRYLSRYGIRFKRI